MTREDIIPSRTDVLSMAREVWTDIYDVESYERFAALIASRVAAKASAASASVEREACAKVVEESPSYDWHRFACEAAAAIRARGQE